MPGATITRGILSAFAGKTSGQLFPLLCLAPYGVFRATSLTRRSGGLLPRLFTLAANTQLAAVYSLWHCPSKSLSAFLPRVSHPNKHELRGIAPSGVRTFLPGFAPEAILRPSKINLKLPAYLRDDKFRHRAGCDQKCRSVFHNSRPVFLPIFVGASCSQLEHGFGITLQPPSPGDFESLLKHVPVAALDLAGANR